MRYLFFTISIVAIFSCTGVKEDLLLGKWQAVEILEDGTPLEVDMAPIGFAFDDQGYYNYSSTINYKEAGTYYLEGPYLYTLDTINAASTEKAVRINSLTQDSLILLMSVKGKEKIMKLLRKD